MLLATSWGGTQYPWASPQVLVLYAAGALLLTTFLFNERRAEEPVIPLELWRNRTFTLSNIANLAVAMGMFGAIFYVPVFAQGALGATVTESGTITIPLTASMILVSIVVGRLITRTGRYKGFILAGTLVMCVGYLLLTRLGAGSSQNDVRLDLIVLGLGLGAVQQTYTLIVQNSVGRQDLGVATAATQFTRSTGATLGVAVFGTILTANLQSQIPRNLPQGAGEAQASRFAEGSGLGAALNPGALGQLPDAVASGVQEGLAASMHAVFIAGVPIVAVAFVASLFIKELPLRTTSFAEEDEGTGTIKGLNQRSAECLHHDGRQRRRQGAVAEAGERDGG